MQPIYLTGHSRPVRKVMHNMDGDLLFTCSDDGTVCMYETSQCIRLGLFDVKEACRSIDVTKDSKYLIAASVTVGYIVFNVKDGKTVTTVRVQPSHQFKQVALSFGDKELLTIADYQKSSVIRIFDFEHSIKKKEDEAARII